MTLTSGGGVYLPLVGHHPAFPSIWPAFPSLRWDLSTNPGLKCSAYVDAAEEMMWLFVGVRQRGHSGNGYDLASTLCRYDLRKGNLFVLCWARMRRVRPRKYLFRAANVWRMYAQYFDITSCG